MRATWSTLVVVSAFLAQSPGDRTSVKDVLAAGTVYLAGYQQQLAFLLADERTTQRVYDGAGRETATRVTRGEFFVTYVPGDRMWMSVRDVAEVDGRPVPDREDLRALLRRESIAGAARTLIRRNAQFNIGNVTRNFNEPTLGLAVLDPRRRSQFRFSRKTVAREGEAALVTLEFKEADGPTLVRSERGGNVPSRGDLAIEADTGRIRRTHVQLRDGPVEAELTTAYDLEPALDTWVPTTFTERYERTKDERQLIVCETRYSNYRRFEVDVRIR